MSSESILRCGILLSTMRLAKIIVVAAMSLTLRSGRGQACPTENPNGTPIDSGKVTLSGTVVYHDEIRKWVELQLQNATCGQKSVQLLEGEGGAFEVDEGDSHSFEELRGCRVTVEGTLGIPGTGYYSADIFLNAERVTPASDCVKKSKIPDYSQARPQVRVKKYTVTMLLDYRARGGRIDVEIRSGGIKLSPWQAYANYFLTGGYVLYGNCAKNFKVGKVFGTPEAVPSHFDTPGTVNDRAAFDPESAADKHISRLRLGYTCFR